MFQTLSTLSLPKPYDQMFLQRTLLPFSGGWHLEAKTQLLRVLAAVGGVSLLRASPWGEQTTHIIWETTLGLSGRPFDVSVIPKIVF